MSIPMALKYKWQRAICIVWANSVGTAVNAASNPVVVVPKEKYIRE